MTRWAKRLAFAVALVVVAAFVVAETAGRVAVERIAEDQIRDAGVAGGVDVTVGKAWWRPSIVPAALLGNLDRVKVRLDDAQLYSMPVKEADYVLEDLGVDLSWRDRTVTATSLGSGTVSVRIDPASIAKLVGANASIDAGKLHIGNDPEPARIEMTGANLTITAPGLDALTGVGELSFPVVDPQILPCTPEVHLRSHFLELSCTGQELPGVLQNSIGTNSGSFEYAPGGQGEILPPEIIEAPDSSASDATPRTTASTAPSTTGG